jgi:hypothetical protein
MALGKPFQYVPLTDLGQALRDVGLAYLQGLKSPEELEKERVLALQAQLAIDQARQKIEAERQAQLARQGLASTLGSMTPDPTLGNILRNAAMMSGDPAVTAGFAAMPGAVSGNAAAMAPWFSLYTKKPLDPKDALTVQHQREIAARDQQNALQRVLTEIAARAAAEEQLLRTKAALAQEAETRPLSDVDLAALGVRGIDLPPGTSAGIAKMLVENASKTMPMEDVAALIGAVGGQVPDAVIDRAAEGSSVPTPLAQALLAQVGRAGIEAAKGERDTVSINEVMALNRDLGEALRELGVERVSKEFLKQATRKDVAALRAMSQLEAARIRALDGVEPVTLGQLRDILVSAGVKVNAANWPENVQLPARLTSAFITAIRTGAPLDDETEGQLARAFGLLPGTLRGLTQDAAIKAATGAARAAAAAEQNEINRLVADIRERLGLSRLALYGRELDLREQKQLTDAELRQSALELQRQRQATDADLRQSALELQRQRQATDADLRQSALELQRQRQATDADLRQSALELQRQRYATDAEFRQNELALRRQKLQDEGERWRSELEFKRGQAEAQRSLDEQKLAIQRDLARIREQEMAARNELAQLRLEQDRLNAENSAKAAQLRVELQKQRNELEQKRQELVEKQIELKAEELALKQAKFTDPNQAADFLGEFGISVDPNRLPKQVEVGELFATVRSHMKRQVEQRAQDLRAQQEAERLRVAEDRVKEAVRARRFVEGQSIGRAMAKEILEGAGVQVDEEIVPDKMRAGELASLVRAQASLTRARAETARNMANTIPSNLAREVLSKWGLSPETLDSGLDKLTPQAMREVTRGLEAAYRAFNLTVTAKNAGVSDNVLRLLYESAGLQPPENLEQKAGDPVALAKLAKLRQEEARRERRVTTPWSEIVGIARAVGVKIDEKAFNESDNIDATAARTMLQAILPKADKEKEVDPDVVRKALTTIGADPNVFVGQPMTVRELTDIIRVLSNHMAHMERLETAKAVAAARVADRDRLTPVARMKVLTDAVKLLEKLLGGVDGRRDKKAEAILQNHDVKLGIVNRALKRAELDGRSLLDHYDYILRNEVEFTDNWFVKDTVALKEEKLPVGEPSAQAAPQAAMQPIAPGGPASVLMSAPATNIIDAPKSKAGLQALPDGALIRDPSTGLMFEKRGDRFVLFQGAQK